MTATQFTCPHCSGVFQIETSMLGQEVACPHCQSAVLTPPLDPPTGAAPPPPPVSVPPPPPPANSFSPPPPPTFNAPAAPPPPPAASEPPAAPSTKSAPQIGFGPPPSNDPMLPPPPQDAAVEQLSCPLCSGVFQVHPENAGQEVACPHCQGIVAIPGPPPNVEPEQSPSPNVSVPRVRPAGSVGPIGPTPPLEGPSADTNMFPPGHGPPDTHSSTPQLPAPIQPTALDQPTPTSTPAEQAPSKLRKVSRDPDTAAEPATDRPPSPGSAQDQGTPTSSVALPPRAPASEPVNEVEHQADAPEDSHPSSTDNSVLPPTSTSIEDEVSPTTPRANAPVPRPVSPIDNLLPPGATPSQETPATPSPVDSMLPPGAATTDSPPENTPIPVTKSGGDTGPTRGVVIPMEDGSEVELQEPVKTVGYGDDEVALRQLSTEEKAGRRFRRKVIMWVVGLLIILLTVFILLYMGPL